MGWSVCFCTTLLLWCPVKKIKEKRLDYLPVFLLFLIPQMAIISATIIGIVIVAIVKRSVDIFMSIISLCYLLSDDRDIINQNWSKYK